VALETDLGSLRDSRPATALLARNCPEPHLRRSWHDRSRGITSKEVETMKKVLTALAAMVCTSGLVFAGPNAGGTLVAHDAGLLLSATNGSVSICGQGIIPATCGAIDSEIDGATMNNPAIFKVYAAFPQGSAPRLMGLTWGVIYDADLILPNWGMCGNFELNDTNWPGSGTGSSVTYDSPQTGLLTAVYWFAAYNYNYAPAVLQLGANPSQGGVFGDDSVPAVLDPIAGYGAMGLDRPGVLVCPPPPEPGACCDPCTAACTVVLMVDCQGDFLGEGTVCEPNPCPAPPSGACCDADLNCTFLPQCFCTGTYLGDGVLCEPYICEPRGACCPYCSEYCIISTGEECAAQGGTYMGDGTTCDPGFCVLPPPVACCLPDGSCIAIHACACDGVWYDASCDPNPCSTPVERTSWGGIKNRYKGH
jgi:hypothetical protein